MIVLILFQKLLGNTKTSDIYFQFSYAPYRNDSLDVSITITRIQRVNYIYMMSVFTILNSLKRPLLYAVNKFTNLNSEAFASEVLEGIIR